MTFKMFGKFWWMQLLPTSVLLAFAAFVKDTIKDLNLDFGGSTQKRANCSGFVIVGAGLPRTGTLSIQSALSHLLDGPCYHMHDVCSNDQVDLSFWHKVRFGCSITGIE